MMKPIEFTEFKHKINININELHYSYIDEIRKILSEQEELFESIRIINAIKFFSVRMSQHTVNGMFFKNYFFNFKDFQFYTIYSNIQVQRSSCQGLYSELIDLNVDDFNLNKIINTFKEYEQRYSDICNVENNSINFIQYLIENDILIKYSDLISKIHFDLSQEEYESVFKQESISFLKEKCLKFLKNKKNPTYKSFCGNQFAFKDIILEYFTEEIFNEVHIYYKVEVVKNVLTRNS